jgi:hypothetical protein
MGERRLVALLKELLSLIGVLRFYEYCTATRFFPTDSPGLVVRVANPMAHAMGCRSFAAPRLRPRELISSCKKGSCASPFHRLKSVPLDAERQTKNF